MRILHTRRSVGRAGAVLVVALGAFTIAHTAGVAWAHPIEVWVHDHSSDVIGPRPDGLSEIQATFGPVCGDNSNGARSYWPAQSSDGAGYVYYDTYIGKNVGGNIRNHVMYDRKDGAVRWLAATTAGTSAVPPRGRCTHGARRSTRTARRTLWAKITGTASGPTERSTGPTCQTSGEDRTQGTTSSGVSAGPPSPTPCTSSTRPATDQEGTCERDP